ncbi:hypothetical protein ACFWIW_02145 [Amycolatopsis sp. NPDC058340]|uniref:hypothetical protein n=1 Tax=Amycolatopsis sp. NPDC058340 TaxID=3346453 RepID=UPI00364B73D6
MRDEKEFRRACYEAARRTRGRVAGFVSYKTGSNFDQCEIVYRHRTAAVLWAWDLDGAVRNGLGIAESPVSWGSITFVDEPGLLAVLGELLPEFRLHTRAELEQPIDLSVPPWVNNGHAQSWRPDSLGEALFNYWD